MWALSWINRTRRCGEVGQRTRFRSAVGRSSPGSSGVQQLPRVGEGQFCDPHTLKSLAFSSQCFVETAATKQFSWVTKPFSPCGADIRKQPLVIKLANETADSAGSRTRRHQMRTVSFILAFAFILAGPSIAGSSSSEGLPGIGTFAYNGSPATNSAPQALVVAGR
jgi:hypothetical protein